MSVHPGKIMTFSVLTALLGLSLTAGVQPAQAQVKKPGSKKAAPVKPAAGPSKTIVLGTTQLPGDFGKMGTTYTIGKSEPVNFTLKSADYSITPWMVGGSVSVPKANQKLLILHYTIQNPLPKEQSYSGNRVRFTTVDAQDENQEMISSIAREGTTENLTISLKPAQKIDVTAAIMVSADGVVPKLIVEREQGAPVIRYDLRGKVTPLPPSIAPPPRCRCPQSCRRRSGSFLSHRRL